MFKVVLNDGPNLPDDKILYIVSKNGIFLKKKVGIVESLTKVPGVSFLQEIKPYAKLHIQKIPAKTFGKIISFFRKVHEIHKSECNALLYYNEKDKSFRVVIPPQEVGSNDVKYLRIPAMKNYVRLSTIHSHPTFPAFHSYTDITDEKDSDGLHITVGKIVDEVFEIVASIVVGGTRFKVEPQDYIEGIKKVQKETEFPEVTMYRNPFLPQLFKETNKNFSIFRQPSYKEGYVFTKWSKKFEKFNPDWINQVKPVEIKLEWDDELVKFKKDKILVEDIFPEEDMKNKRREVVNPCKTCVFKKFIQEEENLVGEKNGLLS